jgi:hypothetical protein
MRRTNLFSVGQKCPNGKQRIILPRIAVQLFLCAAETVSSRAPDFLPVAQALLHAPFMGCWIMKEGNKWKDLPRAALENLALEAYRTRKLSTEQMLRLLGFETRYDLDGFLNEIVTRTASLGSKSTPIVICDASPLHYLVLVGQTGLLHALYGRILIPGAVVEELQRTRTPESIRIWLSRPPAWLDILPTSDCMSADSLLAGLGAGEREVIALAFAAGGPGSHGNIGSAGSRRRARPDRSARGDSTAPGHQLPRGAEAVTNLA